jgi:protein SCO1/2
MLRIVVVALVLLAGATVWLSSQRQLVPAPVMATELPELRALPAVAFTDQLGRDFAIADLAGDFSLLFFGFSNCPDICPLTLQTLANVEAKLAAEGVQPPQIVLVSVDPERDTPERLRRYLGNFSPRFFGVTTPRAQLQPLIATLGVVVERHEHGDGAAYDVTHNSTIFVLGPQAEWIALFSAPHDAATIASDYLRIRQRYLRRQPAAPASS